MHDRGAVRQLLPILVLAGVAVAAWAGWLGWDQEYDEQPDGTVSGPYEAWQVGGLVLTLLAAVCLAAYLRYAPAAVIGTTAGLTAAAWYDWSDDQSGLYMVGVILVAAGTATGTAVACAATRAVARRLRPGGG